MRRRSRHSQSVRTSEQGGVRGYDGAKKLCGRKRHLLVDTLGLVLLVVVTAANVQDRDGARTALSALSLELGSALAARLKWLKLLVRRSGRWQSRKRPGAGKLWSLYIWCLCARLLSLTSIAAF